MVSFRQEQFKIAWPGHRNTCICTTNQNKEIIISKLYFENAFDKIEHQAMLDIMRFKGSGDRWLSWMQLIFNTGTSSILLNGVPGKTIHCRRGVRQGYPLSPLLFVLAADLLQSVLNNARSQGQLKLPIPLFHSKEFPILQYVDDTLVLMEACPNQLIPSKVCYRCSPTQLVSRSTIPNPCWFL